MFYFLRFSFYRFCQQKSATFNILFDNVFKRVKGKRKAASSRSAIEWIMRGAAEMFIVGTPIQKRVKRREEGARGWREVSSKVLTRGGGGGRGWRRRYKPPASFTPPPLSFPLSSPEQNRGELCHRGCCSIRRFLEREGGGVWVNETLEASFFFFNVVFSSNC